MQSLRHGRLVLAVSGLAAHVVNVYSLGKGCHVKDGLFPWIGHHPDLIRFVGPGQAIGNWQGAVVTVTENLEVLSQHQRPPHHTQDRL